MDNIGPINGDEKLKTGKEFLNEILLASDNEEDELLEEETSLLINQQQQQSSNLMAGQNQNSKLHDESTHSLSNESDKKSFKNSTERFKENGRNIILNLSKYTLRKIIMLICDEGVRLFFFFQ
jgi:hypothetical protein